MQSEQEAQARPEGHPIPIEVNDKPVTAQGPRTNGLEVKEAAIAQHVDIQLDFILSQELGGGRTKIIGNTDPVTIHKGSRFVAIPNDDNS
jgi:Multiubiquitin